MESHNKLRPPVPAQGGAEITGTPVSDMATCAPARASALQAVPSCLSDCDPTTIHLRMEITDSPRGERDLPAASGGRVSQPPEEGELVGTYQD